MNPHSRNTRIKVLYAFSLPPLLILVAASGSDRGDAYWFIATFFIALAGICLGSVVPKNGNKLVVGVVYAVVLEVVMSLL